MKSGDADAQAAALAALRDADHRAGDRPTQPTQPTQPAQPAQPGVQPINWATEPPPVFTNGVQVLHRPTDFAVIFTEHTPFPGRHAPDGKPGAERAAVVCSLRTHPAAFFQMVCAMASNWNRFASTLIDPSLPRPRFRLVGAGDLQLEHAPPAASDE
jgi:hypothetical protein